MKRRGLYILGTVIAVVVIILLVLPFAVNANRFRPTIETQLRSSLGRKVDIGDLGLSLLSGGVVAKNIAIADDPKFSPSPFLQAKSLAVSVQLLPLVFSRALRVTGLTIDQPQVMLLRSATGTWNFSSLGAGQKSTPGEAAPNFSVQTLRVKNGKVSIGNSPQHSKPTTYEHVNLTARNVGFDSTIPFTFDARTSGDGSVKLEGTAGPIDRADAALTPLNAKVSVQHLDLATTGFLDASSGLAGVLDFMGNVKSDGRMARSEGSAKVDKLRVVRTGSPAKQPVTLDYASDYDLRKQTGVLSKGDLHTGKSTVHLAGTYDTHGQSTVVHMKVNGSRLPVQDLEGLLPALGVVLPAGTSLEGGTLDSILDLNGPVDRLVTTGNIDLSNAKLAGFNLASKLSSVAALAGMEPQSDTLIQTLSSNLRIAPEGIRADNLNLIVPSIGSMVGNGTIGANNSLNFHMVAKLANANSAVGTLTARIPGMAGNQGTIPFRIEGTTAQPIFVPDVAGAVSGGLLKSLGGKLGQAPAQNQGQQQGADQGLGGVLSGILGKKK